LIARRAGGPSRRGRRVVPPAVGARGRGHRGRGDGARV